MKGPFRFSFRAVVAATLFIFSALAGEAKQAKMLDIDDTVSANRILTKFASIIAASDLATFLSSRGPFTLFVPTDSAFSKLPPGMLDALLRPENKERLQRILLYHVVNGKRFSAKDLQKITSLPSCEGSPLAIKVLRAGTQTVAKAKIVHGDIRCGNGVIHEIDTLLIPPESTLPPLVTTPPPAPSTDAATTNAAPVSATNAAPATTNAPPAAL